MKVFFIQKRKLFCWAYEIEASPHENATTVKKTVLIYPYTNVEIISSRDAGNMSITGISGMV